MAALLRGSFPLDRRKVFQVKATDCLLVGLLTYLADLEILFTTKVLRQQHIFLFDDKMYLSVRKHGNVRISTLDCCLIDKF